MSNNEHLVITMPDGTKVEIGSNHLPVTTGFPENLPKLYLNPEKGSKLDIIRIYYVISELNLIVDQQVRFHRPLVINPTHVGMNRLR